MHIAFLAADPQDAAQARAALERLGHGIAVFTQPAELLAAARRDAPHLLLLDWQEGCAELLAWARDRQAGRPPVLCLASQADTAAHDAILAGGADDYLLKPLRVGELQARVAALLRHAWPQAAEPEWLAFGRFAFEPRSGRVRVDGAEIPLTRKEFELALLFFRHLGRPLSRAYLLEAVWEKDSEEVTTRTVDTHVSRVRSKLGLLPARGLRLVPVYSFGYRLEALPD